MNNIKEKVLVIRLSSLGDVSLISPVIEILNEKFEVHILTRRLPANIFLGDPRVAKVWVFENYKHINSLIVKLAKEKFSHVIDLHLQPRTAFITSSLKFSGAKIHKYRKETICRNLILKTGNRNICKTNHVIYRYLHALKFIDTQDNLWSSFKLKMPFFKEEYDEFNEKYEKILDKISNTVFFAIGAKYQSKRWPIEYFRELGQHINNNGMYFGIVGGPEDKKVGYELTQGFKGFNFAGLLPRETILLLNHAKLIVTNDSSHVHMGMLAGIPVIDIFGPTVKEFGFYPLGKYDRIIETDLNCRPCSMHGEKKCKRDDFACMREIKPERVFDEVLSVLKRVKEDE